MNIFRFLANFLTVELEGMSKQVIARKAEYLYVRIIGGLCFLGTTCSNALLRLVSCHAPAKRVCGFCTSAVSPERIVSNVLCDRPTWAVVVENL